MTKSGHDSAYPLVLGFRKGRAWPDPRDGLSDARMEEVSFPVEVWQWRAWIPGGLARLEEPLETAVQGEDGPRQAEVAAKAPDASRND